MRLSRIERLERQALKAVVALYRADLAYCSLTPGAGWERRAAKARQKRYELYDATLRAARALDDARAEKRRKERAR